MRWDERAHWCPFCDTRLIVTPSKYFTCPAGCTKLIHRKRVYRFAQNAAQRAADQAERERFEAEKMEILNLPFAVFKYRLGRTRVFTAESAQGVFTVCNPGAGESFRAFWLEKRKVIVLRPMTAREIDRVFFNR